MRDLIVLAFVGGMLTLAIRYPFAGLLTWAWFTIMTPHQLAFGVFGIPLNMIIAAVTIVAFLFHGEFKNLGLGAIQVFIGLFAIWMVIAQSQSLDPANSGEYVDRLLKTLLFILLCILGTTTKLRFHALLWTLVAGIGFYAFKGGLFTLATLGEFRVQGLANTVLEDNNHMGIAIATILPLILYLRNVSAAPWLKSALLVVFAVSIVAVIGTHSRGAFVALAAFAGLYWLRSKYKVSIAAGFTVLLIPTIAFMPAKWVERMSTISSASEDASFSGRVDAWEINYKLAQANPITGAGLRNPYNEAIAATVDPELAKTAKAAHSIYFEVLGGSGFIGLALYLSIFAAALLSTWSMYRRGRKGIDEPWLRDFSFYASISILIFMVGGASTSMEMWDGYLVVIALVAAAERIAKTQHAIELKPVARRIRKQTNHKRAKNFRGKPGARSIGLSRAARQELQNRGMQPE